MGYWNCGIIDFSHKLFYEIETHLATKEMQQAGKHVVQ